MWISGVHVVIVYFCVCGSSADLRSETRLDGKQNRIRRSAYNLNIDNYNSNKYDNYNSLSTLKLRHQSRFPNLEKVMTRINNMKLGSEDRNVYSGVHNRLRHNSWYERTTTTTTPKTAEIFENYFDEDYEEDKEEDGNSWEYEDDNEYTDYDDDDLFSESSEWQAEEPTEKPTTPTPTPRQMSKISSLKWQMYGTRQKVEENRNKEMFSELARSVSSATLAKDHFRRMYAEAFCKKPFPRVLSVQSEHPDPSRDYTPKCTVLYRCAEDTGCCHHHSLRCAPKTQEDVNLYFYAKTLDTLQRTVVKLTFQNHTECHCVVKEEYKPKNTTIDLKSGDSNRNIFPENLENCPCPGSFIPKKKYGSLCTCKCDESKPECQSKMEGLEFFSLADRKCVLENRCGIPICEYGSYLRKKGRCPKAQEKLDAFENINI